MPDSPTTAERLRTLRAARGLNQSDIAKAAGVNVRTYGFWERGSTEPGASSLAKICDFYGVAADYVLGRTDAQSGLPGGSWVIDEDRVRRMVSGTEKRVLPIGFRIPNRCRVVDDETAEKIDLQVEQARRAR